MGNVQMTIIFVMSVEIVSIKDERIPVEKPFVLNMVTLH